jgi:RHS repeat-associated protein
MLTNISRTKLTLLAVVVAAGLGVSASPRQTNSSSSSGGAPQTRLDGAAQTLLPNGLVLLTGGTGADGADDRTALWNPATDVVTPLRVRLNHPRARHTATLLADGRVLVLGGVDSDGHVLAAPELLDVSTLRSQPLEAAQWRARAHHTTTVLSDGRVLSVGGESDNGFPLNDADLWDPTTNVVTVLGMFNGREGHTATLESDGTVRISGGTGAGSARPPDEWFDPLSGVFVRSAVPATIDADPIAASTPMDGTTDVSTDVIVAVRFATPMQVQSLNSRTAVLRAGSRGVRALIVPVEGGRLVFVRPEARLEDSTEYTLSLGGVIRSNGEPLDNTLITFTTASSPNDQVAAPTDDTWAPALGQLQGEWRTNRADSPFQKLSPLQAAPGVTALSGQVLLLNGNPLADVTLSIEGRSARSDRTGRFLIEGLGAGRHVLRIDGRAANRPQRTYGIFDVGVFVRGGRTNVLWYTVWMPVIDTRHSVTIASPTQSEVVVTTPSIPGLEVHIPPGTVIRDVDGQVVKTVSITPIPIDRPPYPLPRDVQVPIYFTIQPGGAVLTSNTTVWPAGARVVYPNYRALAAGRRIDFWQYDAEEKDWFVYGRGTVTPDRRQIVPDNRVALYRFTGAMVSDPEIIPPKGPEPGDDDDKDGEPVDLSTGQFVMTQTDLSVPDVIPLAITRTYRPQDTESRAFGVGSTLDYNMFMAGDIFPYTYQILVLPDGGQVRFDRISYGTGFEDAVYRHLGSPSRFYGATLQWNTGAYPPSDLLEGSNAWQLTLKDGTSYFFPEAEGNDNPAAAAVTMIRDRNGNTVRIVRAQDGSITSIESPNGRWIHPTYDDFGRITKMEDQANRTVLYTYDASGRLWKVTDPNGGVTEYAYDAGGRLETLKDPRGTLVLTNVYNPEGRVATQTLPGGATYQFDYTLDVDGKIVQTDVTNPRGYVRRVTFNADGYTMTDTKAYGTTVAQASMYARQSGSNLPLSITDALGRKTAYSYDSLANVTSITRLADTPDAVTSNYTYEPVGSQLLTSTDALGHTTTFAYDDRGNLSSITDANGNSSSVTRDSNGRVISVTDPAGQVSQFTYTGADLTQTTDSLGHVTSRRYDADGQTIEFVTSRGNATRYEYNASGQVTGMVDPVGGETASSWDPNGNLLSLINSRNQTTSFTYDPLNRPMTRSDALARTDQYAYDLQGNLTQLTDRKNQVTSMTYDALDRLLTVTYADSTLTYSYDLVGRVTSISDSASATITRTYDALDRVLTETTAAGVTSYQYDAVGRRIQMTAPGQLATTYTYDAGNRVTSITRGSQVIDISYDGANRRTSLSMPNGVLVLYGYDAASRLTSLTYKVNGLLLGDLQYSYDDDGNITGTGGTLARIALPSSLPAPDYDAANQLLTRSGQSYEYDANGNMVSDGVSTYSWNARGQLVSIAGPVPASFSYDALGRRTQKIIAGVATDFIYDGDNVIREIGTNSSVDLLTGMTADERFTRTDITGTQVYIVDGIQSTIALVDDAGTTPTEYTYEPFGVDNAPSGTTNAYTFSGREHDGTGLNYHRARYYAPAIGRFISEDPLGGVNHFAYVGNNPLSYADPLGLCRVQVNFWRLGPGYYHAYILTSDALGTTYFRGGPGAGGPSSGSSGASSSGSGGSSSHSCKSGSSSSNSSNSSSPGSGGNGGNTGPWGPLSAVSGPYVPGTVDWDPGNPPTMTVLDNGLPCSIYNQPLANSVSAVNSANIPYNPFSTNSNAFVNNALTWSGITHGQPPVWAPGWNTPLPH